MNNVIESLKAILLELEAAEGLTLKEYKSYNKDLEQIDKLLCAIAEKVDEKPRLK